MYIIVYSREYLICFTLELYAETNMDSILWKMQNCCICEYVCSVLTIIEYLIGKFYTIYPDITDLTLNRSDSHISITKISIDTILSVILQYE